MADERDPQISQRYRELGAEQPSPELDRAILAASRRATSRYRWYSSLAAAAVLIFAVAIVAQMERQAPDQVPISAPSAPVGRAPSEEQAAPQQREAPPTKPALRRRAETQFAPEPPAPAPAPSANVAAPAEAGAAAERKRADEMRAAPQLQRSTAAPRSAADAQANVVETPDQWLARIARLRELGRDEEADKELARFRERYPDYRIPEAMAKRVEKQAPGAPAK